MIATGMTTRPSTVPIETLAFGGTESGGERGRAPTANIATLCDRACGAAVAFGWGYVKVVVNVRS